jgi:hypothetical protein
MYVKAYVNFQLQLYIKMPLFDATFSVYMLHFNLTSDWVGGGSTSDVWTRQGAYRLAEAPIRAIVAWLP